MNDQTAQAAIPGGAPSETSVVDRVAERAHEAVDSVAAKVKPAVDRVQSVASQTAESFQDKANALSDLEKQWLGGARAQIREQPLTAVAVGLLAGVLLSRLGR